MIKLNNRNPKTHTKIEDTLILPLPNLNILGLYLFLLVFSILKNIDHALKQFESITAILELGCNDDKSSLTTPEGVCLSLQYHLLL